MAKHFDAALRTGLRKAVRNAIGKAARPWPRVDVSEVVIAGVPWVITRRADGVYILGER